MTTLKWARANATRSESKGYDTSLARMDNTKPQQSTLAPSSSQRYRSGRRVSGDTTGTVIECIRRRGVQAFDNATNQPSGVFCWHCELARPADTSMLSKAKGRFTQNRVTQPPQALSQLRVCMKGSTEGRNKHNPGEKFKGGVH